ncbi:phosphatase PAP2 family protein [Vibrio sp.]|uniref:phosphatase PAP2 family protein n=1 Tax=Vibrio sp. TaxID=678 RepID=UPI003D0BD351
MMLTTRPCRRTELWLLTGFMLVLVLLTGVTSMVNWSSFGPEWLTRFWFALTQTAGKEGFVLTLVVLMIWVYWRVPSHRQQWLNRGIQLVLLLLFTMLVKVGLKQVTHSPRPYTEVMVQKLILPAPEHFYRLDRQQQEAVIGLMADSTSPYRLRVWLQERDFSFPSGHTTFAVTCLLFFGGLLVEQKRWISVALLFSWSSAIALSRLWLVMHRPEDLWAATLLVGLVYLLIPRRYPWLEEMIASLSWRRKKKMG